MESYKSERTLQLAIPVFRAVKRCNKLRSYIASCTLITMAGILTAMMLGLLLIQLTDSQSIPPAACGGALGEYDVCAFGALCTEECQAVIENIIRQCLPEVYIEQPC